MAPYAVSANQTTILFFYYNGLREVKKICLPCHLINGSMALNSAVPACCSSS